MAIILYQIGKYVNLLGSSMQAWNMVRGTDIFGISDREKDIVACIVYYDHKGIPNDDDEPFRILSDESKMTALKQMLATIWSAPVCLKRYLAWKPNWSGGNYGRAG